MYRLTTVIDGVTKNTESDDPEFLMRLLFRLRRTHRQMGWAFYSRYKVLVTDSSMFGRV